MDKTLQICRYCKKEINKEDEIETFAYWMTNEKTKNVQIELRPKFYSHKECLLEGKKKEAYDCQKVDQDCNDCKYFIRKEMLNKGVFTGQCSKFDKEVKAYPNFCSGHECFVHRLD